jgi:DNA-binding winged helix-turn-helix (wHTH) protein
MPTPPTGSAGGVVRFGIFEVDLVAGELRKSGVRVRLQEQPFQVLCLLMQRSGKVVTREELRQQLWPADTFVDFDHSLNTAVNKLREALGDSASTPRYVETVARRGYRFLAAAERADGNTGMQVSASPVSPNRTPDPAPALDPELQVPLPNRGVTRGLFGLIQIMYLAFYLAALFRFRDVEKIVEDFLPPWAALPIFVAVLVTAAVGIPLRCYLLTAAAFDYRRLGENFNRLFLFILPLDQLWAVTPFLLTPQIGFGAAFAVTAALLYVPFAERTLVRMAYPKAAT